MYPNICQSYHDLIRNNDDISSVSCNPIISSNMKKKNLDKMTKKVIQIRQNKDLKVYNCNFNIINNQMIQQDRPSLDQNGIFAVQTFLCAKKIFAALMKYIKQCQEIVQDNQISILVEVTNNKLGILSTNQILETDITNSKYQETIKGKKPIQTLFFNRVVYDSLKLLTTFIKQEYMKQIVQYVQILREFTSQECNISEKQKEYNFQNILKAVDSKNLTSLFFNQQDLKMKELFNSLLNQLFLIIKQCEQTQSSACSTPMKQNQKIKISQDFSLQNQNSFEQQFGQSFAEMETMVEIKWNIFDRIVYEFESNEIY